MEREQRSELGEEDVHREDVCPECGGTRDERRTLRYYAGAGTLGPVGDLCENEYHDDDS